MEFRSPGTTLDLVHQGPEDGLLFTKALGMDMVVQHPRRRTSFTKHGLFGLCSPEPQVSFTKHGLFGLHSPEPQGEDFHHQKMGFWTLSLRGRTSFTKHGLFGLSSRAWTSLSANLKGVLYRNSCVLRVEKVYV